MYQSLPLRALPERDYVKMLKEWMASGMLQNSITMEDNIDQLSIIKLLRVSLVEYYEMLIMPTGIRLCCGKGENM